MTAEQQARASGGRLALAYLAERHARAGAGPLPGATVVMFLGQTFADWILTGEIPEVPAAEESA